MDGSDFVLWSVGLGCGATAVMDTWMVARHRLFGIAPADYGLVGRWLGHMPRGRFMHERIAAAAPIASERLIGWTAHYATGIAFASLFLAIAGDDWLREPTPTPAIALGLGTVAEPFLLMQPGMGAGIAASRTPRPGSARVQSVLTHAIFGAGLYLTGLALRAVAG